MTNLVEIRDLTIDARTDSGRVVEIIRGVSLDVRDGEMLALIGESGSGKTTLALSLLGHARPGCRFTGGTVTLDGQEMTRMPEVRRAVLRGSLVAYVPQSAAAAFNPARLIIDQLVEVVAIHESVPRAAARARALELINALGLPEPERIGFRYPHQVSGGQLQRLATVMALIGRPKLVIFDEPTTALDVTTQIEVLRAFKRVMKAQSITGVYVSHDLAVVAQMADRIAVLRDGAVQEIGETAQILRSPQHPYTKQLLHAFSPSDYVPPAARARPGVLLQAEITAGYGPRNAAGEPTIRVLDQVSITLEKGRALGIVGESGCGKSTLARALSGILPLSRGQILFDGRTLAPAMQQRTKQDLQRMQIVFQLADTAINPRKRVADIIGRPLSFYHGLKGAAWEARVDELLDMVHLPRTLKNRLPGELSGGQKQRVNLARALAAGPSSILCDEITSALDAVVADAIIDLLRELRRALDLSFIFISHDLATVQSLCDEIIVMYKGQKVEEMRPVSLGGAPQHPYSQLLFASTPTLDPGWLDGLEQNEAFQKAFAGR